MVMGLIKSIGPFKVAVGSIFTLYCINGLRKAYLSGYPRIFYNDKDERMKYIMSRMTSLKEPFRICFWSHGNYAQMFLLLFWRAVYRNSCQYDEFIISDGEGGELAIDVFREPQKKLSHDAPIVVILHTITGTPDDECEFANYLYKKGWRAIILKRRGHFGKLKTPKFNLMGCVHDTELMLKFVKEKYPDSFIGAVGLSAGSGQLVSFLGHQDGDQYIQAAASICPAYSIEDCFKNFQKSSPILAHYLLLGLKRFFLKNNEEILQDQPGYTECLQSKTIQTFFEEAIYMAGHTSMENYLEKTDPIRHYHGNQIPCLVLNATDDPLSVEENIRYDIATESENYMLVLTHYGSHVAYREGFLGASSYIHRLSYDFLNAHYLNSQIGMGLVDDKKKK